MSQFSKVKKVMYEQIKFVDLVVANKKDLSEIQEKSTEIKGRGGGQN